MTYLHYLILSLVAISGVFLIGKIIFNVLKLSMPYPYQTFFLKSFLGTCLLSFVTAIFSTRFQSILILFLLIALFILLFSLTIKTLPLNHQITNKKTSYRWVTIEALLLCSFVFTIRFFHLYQQDGIFAIPHPDYVYYTRLSSYLLNFGIENSQIEPVFVESHGTKPYHYFELWLNGAFIFASGLNGLIVLMTVTYSLLTVLVWAGIMACVEEIKKRISWSDKLLGAVLLFICGLYLPFYSNSSFLSSSATFSFSLWTQPKISVIYLFILPGILFLLKGNKRMAVCCFLLLPVVYITTAPGVLAGLVLWIVIDYFFYNRDANSMGQALTGIILTALAIIGFYLITEQNSEGSKLSWTSHLWFWLKQRTPVNIVGGASIQMFILYAPLLFLTLFPQRKLFLSYIKKNSFVWLLVCMYVCSLLSWSLIGFMLDSVQLFSNLIPSLINIILILLTFILSSPLRVSVVSLVLVIILRLYWINGFIYSHCSEAYIKEVCPEIKNINPLVVFLNTPYYPHALYKNHFITLRGGNFIQCRSDLYPVSLSIFDIPVDSNGIHASQEEAYIKNSTFYRFVNKQKLNGTFVSVKQSQLDFISIYKVQCLLLDPNVEVPLHFKPFVSKITTDPVSGERFILLKKN